MRVVAVVQARVGSSRLPAKVLLSLGGATVLERCLRRVERIPGLSDVVVATTHKPDDDMVVRLARRLGYRFFRGSENDVLSRYVEAAREAAAEAVVRCTSDCPLLDSETSGPVVQAFLASQTEVRPLDYAANNLIRRLPRGMDTEIVSAAALERAHREATCQAEREHVTLHIYRRPETYRLQAVVPFPDRDLSGHRWTLDTLEDYRFLAAIYDGLGAAAASAGIAEVFAFLEKNPELSKINAHIEQKPVAPIDG